MTAVPADTDNTRAGTGETAATAPARRGFRRWFAKLPIDVWFEPLVIIVVGVGFVIWYQSTTFTATESASMSWPALRTTILEHIQLTLVATVIVVCIAIPLGIALTRPALRWLNPIAVNIANIGQAAPAIGLLVLFTFWLGTGFNTAVVGLVVYAVLPILQNTIVGLRQVDQRTVEAARGIGFSGFRTLVQVELPLAVPVILNGVRTALVILVGTATLSTFIGATSLGTLITTGITLFLPKLLVAGAVLVALLAMTIDWLGRLVELAATPRGVA